MADYVDRSAGPRLDHAPVVERDVNHIVGIFEPGGLAEARMLSGDGRFSSIARLNAARYFGTPKIRALFEATFFVGLRRAGVPEE